MHASNPQLEEEKRQARTAEIQQADFTQAVQKQENALRSTEGPSDLEEKVNDGVGLKGVATIFFGALKMAKAKIDYDNARYDQEMRKRHPGFYPSPEDS